MKTVEDLRVIDEARPVPSEPVPLLLTDHDRKAFTKRLNALIAYLGNHGEPDTKLGDIRVLDINVVEGERVTVSSGQDASDFFQIVAEGGRKTAPEVEFIDKREGLVTPKLCARIEIPTDEKSPYNYIVSDEGVFEVATRGRSKQESANGITAPQVIYDTVSPSRSASGKWTKIAPIAIQRLSAKDEKTFMTHLEGRAREQITFPARRPNRHA